MAKLSEDIIEWREDKTMTFIPLDDWTQKAYTLEKERVDLLRTIVLLEEQTDTDTFFTKQKFKELRDLIAGIKTKEKELAN